MARGRFEKCEIFDGINSKTPAGTDWKEEAKFLDYGVTLEGLTPDTLYMYKVGQAVAGHAGDTAAVEKPAARITSRPRARRNSVLFGSATSMPILRFRIA